MTAAEALPLAGLPGPAALGAALSRALRDHPYAASGALNVDSPRLAADAAALWGRLAGLGPADLDAAVAALRAREVQVLAATARPRLGDGACVDVLATLLAQPNVPGGEGLAWDAWLFTNGDARFRSRANAHAASSPALPVLWRRLAAAPTPAAAAAATFLAATGPFEAWASRADVRLDAHRRFLDHVRLALLAPGGLAALDRVVAHETIAAWAAVLTPGERTAWYATFLNETHRARAGRHVHARWPARHAVCAAVFAVARTPNDGLPFWDAVDPAARDAFTLWCRDRELTDLLGGENERVAFWRRYLASVVRMEPNRERSVVFLYGSGWLAVQFVVSGRATFLFRAGVGRGWRRYAEADIYQEVLDLRRRENPAFLGSYEHRGHAETWQRHASDVVERVIRQARAEAGA